MRRLIPLHGLAVLALALLLGGCNKAPAREALGESAQAIAAARPQLEQFAPEELAALRASLAEARAHFDGARYTDALAVAQPLPGRVADALQKAEGRRSEVVAEWSRLAGRVPLILDGAEARSRELAALKSLPGSLTPEAFAGAQHELAATRRAWSAARGVFEAGQAASAVAAAREVQARAEAVAARFGLTPAAAMVAAAAASSAGATSTAAAPGATPPAAPQKAPTPAAPPKPPAAPVAGMPAALAQA